MLSSLDLLSPIVIDNSDANFDETRKYTERTRSPLFNDEEEYVKSLLLGEIPSIFPLTLSRFGNSDDLYDYASFHSFDQSVGFYAKITKDFSKRLASFILESSDNPVVLDPLAGKGYFVKALREQGIKTIGTDNKSWEEKQCDGFESIDALKSLEKYGKYITHLVVSWAPYGSTIDVELYRLLKSKFPHVVLIYIGEHAGGCTGSEQFWDEIESDMDSGIVSIVEKASGHDLGYHTDRFLSDDVFVFQIAEH